MIKALKKIYKIIHDDLKDADMISRWAQELYECDSTKEVAYTIACIAHKRLEMAMEAHKLFVNIVTSESTASKEQVCNCLWEDTHEQMVGWYKEIEERLDKIK